MIKKLPVRSVPTELNEYTTNNEFNAVWTACVADLKRYETFLSYKVPVGVFMKIYFHPFLMLKLYDTDGFEATRGRIVLAMQKSTRFLPIAFNEIKDYSFYKDIPWTDQMLRQYKEAITFDTGYDEIILLEGEQLLFQIYNCDIALPSPCHEDTHVKMGVQCIEGGELVRGALTNPPEPDEYKPSYEKELEK